MSDLSTSDRGLLLLQDKQLPNIVTLVTASFALGWRLPSNAGVFAG